MEAPKVAAIYARVSKDDGSQTPETQARELREYCARQGWTIAREYIDQASGKSGDRDALREMLADASKRKFGILVTWALDRLTREGVAETFDYIRTLNSYGVAYESYQEPHFRTTGPAGELMLAIAAWIARQERQRIAERVTAGLRRARVEGTRSGRGIGRPASVFDRNQAREMRQAGQSWREIGRALGVPAGTVRSALRRGME